MPSFSILLKSLTNVVSRILEPYLINSFRISSIPSFLFNFREEILREVLTYLQVKGKSRDVSLWNWVSVSANLSNVSPFICNNDLQWLTHSSIEIGVVIFFSCGLLSLKFFFSFCCILFCKKRTFVAEHSYLVLCAVLSTNFSLLCVKEDNHLSFIFFFGLVFFHFPFLGFSVKRLKTNTFLTAFL